MSKTYTPSQLTRPAAPRSRKLRGLGSSTSVVKSSSSPGGVVEQTDAVRYSPQQLDESQQMQARKNQGLHYRLKTRVGGELTWNGSATGLEVVTAVANVVRYVRVATTLADATALVGATQVIIDEDEQQETTTWTAGDILDTDDYLQAGDMYIIRKAGAVINIAGNDVAFPYTGTWFADYVDPSHTRHVASVTALTTDTFYNLEMQKIPQEFLPEIPAAGNAVQYVAQTLTTAQQMQARANQGLYGDRQQSTDTIRWDGDITSVEVYESEPAGGIIFGYARIYNGVPTQAQITGAQVHKYPNIMEYISYMEDETTHVNIFLTDDTTMPSLIIALQDNTTIAGMTVAHAGLYSLYMRTTDPSYGVQGYVCKITAAAAIFSGVFPVRVEKKYLGLPDIRIVEFIKTASTYHCSMSVEDIIDLSGHCDTLVKARVYYGDGSTYDELRQGYFDLQHVELRQVCFSRHYVATNYANTIYVECLRGHYTSGELDQWELVSTTLAGA